MIISAIVLLFVGVALAFMMVIKIFEPTLFLNFVAYLSSTMGLILGFVGISQYLRTRK